MIRQIYDIHGGMRAPVNPGERLRSMLTVGRSPLLRVTADQWRHSASAVLELAASLFGGRG